MESTALILHVADTKLLNCFRPSSSFFKIDLFDNMEFAQRKKTNVGKCLETVSKEERLLSIKSYRVNGVDYSLCCFRGAKQGEKDRSCKGVHIDPL